MSKKLRKVKDTIIKPCTNCYSPTHMIFNYSFISYGLDDLTQEEKAALFDRIIDLSSQEYLLISQRRKNTGLELIEENQINKQIPKGFLDSNSHRKFPGKYSVFRLYPNNNPTNGRVIGVFIKYIFYIFYIDPKGKLYNHD